MRSEKSDPRFPSSVRYQLSSGTGMRPGDIGQNSTSRFNRIKRRVVLTDSFQHPAGNPDPRIADPGNGIAPVAWILQKGHQSQLQNVDIESVKALQKALDIRRLEAPTADADSIAGDGVSHGLPSF